MKAYRENFPNNELTDINAGDAASQTNAGFSRELAMISWFARVNYDLRENICSRRISVPMLLPVCGRKQMGIFPFFLGSLENQ